MPAKNKTDLISALCGKLNKRFGGRACKLYDPSNTQCMLLRKKQMEKFWEECRGQPFVMVYEAVQKFLKKFQRMYPGLHIDDYEDVDFKGLVKRLISHPLENTFTIAAWRGYMYKTVYREIKNKFQIPSRERCGTCKYLPELKPLVCQQTGKAKRKTDVRCEEYAPKTGYVKRIDGDKPNETRTSDGLELKIIGVGEEGKSLEDVIAIKELIVKMTEVLSRRIEDAARGSKKREKYQRQYEVFVGLFHSFSEDETYEAAVESLSNAFSVDKKTIQRDISEIENFLKKNVPGL